MHHCLVLVRVHNGLVQAASDMLQIEGGGDVPKAGVQMLIVNRVIGPRWIKAFNLWILQNLSLHFTRISLRLTSKTSPVPL